jgi:hypothetical protein
MNSKFQASDKAFFFEPSIFIKQVYVIKSFGGFCFVRYQKNGGYRVRKSRLFRTETQFAIDYNKKISN